MTDAELLQIIEEAAREGATELDLSGNELTALPAAIGKLTQLKKLILGKYLYDEEGRIVDSIGNNLTALPPEIGQLQQLEELHVVRNQLSQLPPEIRQLSKLKKLDLRGNPVPIPPEILGDKDLIFGDTGDVQEILDFYFRVQDPKETEPLYEAKNPKPDPTASGVKTEEELKLIAAGLEVDRLNLEIKRLEEDKWWKQNNSLIIVIVAGILTLLGNMVVALMNNQNTIKLEQYKANYNLILQALATNDASIAKKNIEFFIGAGFLQDPDQKIIKAITKYQPVLPSQSGKVPSIGTHSPRELASVYNFPSGFDGSGVTIGILELGGAIDRNDITQYFQKLNLPIPDIVPVYVDESSSQCDQSDAQVMMDVEIIGSLAPGAHIRVYFAPNTRTGMAHAITRATADGVSIISSGWGGSETGYKDEEIKKIDTALERAASKNITVLATVDNNFNKFDKQKVVPGDYPASSQWVLAVGGTILKSKGGKIISETPFSESAVSESEKVKRPNWQLSMPTFNIHRQLGRLTPDVAASADPGNYGISILIHGQKLVVGGTSAATPVWAALIARINQALGYNVGYLNPRLYCEIGPSGILHPLSTIGNNNAPGGVGYSTRKVKGWSPGAGWGSPDGTKLLNWLHEHPNPEIGLYRDICKKGH